MAWIRPPSFYSLYLRLDFHIFILINFFFRFCEANQCPCVEAEAHMCGWEVNMQFHSNCSNHYIYEPCAYENQADGMPKTECPNECFYVVGRKERLTATCGECLEWSMLNCLKPGDLSETKMDFPGEHNYREIPKPEADDEFEEVSAEKVEEVEPVEDDARAKDCNNHDTMLEFVLLQDASASYVQDRHNHGQGAKSYLASLKRYLPDILKDLTKEFPGSKFGVTYFVDFEGKSSTTQNDTCYEFIHALTKDHDAFQTGVSKIPTKQHGGDEPESSLTALLYTAVEKKMKWTQEKFSKEGKHVIKVLCVTTDAQWKTNSHPLSEGPEPKGDGTDTCTNGYPSVDLVKKILNDKDFFIVGLIGGNQLNHWLKYMKNLEMKDRSVLYPLLLDGGGAKDVGRKLRDALNEILCLPSIQTTTEESETEEPTTEKPKTKKTTTEVPATEEPETEEPETEEPETEETTTEESTTEEPELETTTSEGPDPEMDLMKLEVWMWQLIAV